MRRSPFTPVLLAALAFAAACPAPSAPGVEDPPERGGVLRVWLAADVASLDPHAAAAPSSWFFARALHRGLLAFPDRPYPDGARPVGDLADLPEVSPDGRTYTFTLRPGARFGRDRPLVAADARASIERLLRSRVGLARSLDVIAGAAAFLGGHAPRVSGLSAPDDRTLVVTLSRRASDLTWILAHPQAAIVPAPTPSPASPISIGGLGPYRLAGYRPEVSITLERNPLWDEADEVRRAWLDGVEARIGGSRAQAVARVTAGRDHVVVDRGPPDQDVPASPPRAGVAVAGSCTRYLFMDTRVRPFGDARVRRAIAAAVDRAALAPHSGAPAGTMLPPAAFGHDPAPAIGQDLAAARASLRAAGTGPFRTQMVLADAPRDRREAAAVADALRRIGVTVTLRAVAPSVLLSDYHARGGRRVALGLATWCADWPGLAGRSVVGTVLDPRERSRPERPPPPALTSSALERAIDRARAAAPDDAVALWRDADRLAARIAVVVPLTWPVEPVVLAPRVRGWAGSPLFPRGDPTSLWLAGT